MYFNFIKGTIFAKKMQEYSIILALYNGEAYFIIQEEEVDMKKYKIGILALAAFGLGTTAASAATINLFEYAFNLDTNVYDVTDGTATGTLPLGVNLGGFDVTTGLGTINFTTSTDGAHSFLAFFDHEIDEATNTFFNEYGNTSGLPATGQSWEIDEPGYVFGDIYSNFVAGNLDNTNAIQQTEDVSMAMGWDFFLAADEIATITMTLSTTQPTGGFYLAQFDPDSSAGAVPAGIYFSSNLNIQGGGIVPEPGTMLLMATGLTGLLGTCARRRMKK